LVTGLLRTILIILAIYFVVRILSRLFAPILNGRSSNGSNSRSSGKSSSRPEGEVRVEYTKKSKSSNGDDNQKEGEYIDFEEID